MKSKSKTQAYREGVPEPEGIGAGASTRKWHFEIDMPLSCTVTADTWFEARNIAAARLGVDPNVLRLM